MCAEYMSKAWLNVVVSGESKQSFSRFFCFAVMKVSHHDYSLKIWIYTTRKKEVHDSPIFIKKEKRKFVDASMWHSTTMMA